MNSVCDTKVLQICFIFYWHAPEQVEFVFSSCQITLTAMALGCVPSYQWMASSKMMNHWVNIQRDGAGSSIANWFIVCIITRSCLVGFFKRLLFHLTAQNAQDVFAAAACPPLDYSWNQFQNTLFVGNSKESTNVAIIIALQKGHGLKGLSNDQINVLAYFTFTSYRFCSDTEYIWWHDGCTKSNFTSKG